MELKMTKTRKSPEVTILELQIQRKWMAYDVRLNFSGDSFSLHIVRKKRGHSKAPKTTRANAASASP